MDVWLSACSGFQKAFKWRKGQPMSACSFATSFKKCTHNVFMAKAVSLCSRFKNSSRCLLSLFWQLLKYLKLLALCSGHQKASKRSRKIRMSVCSVGSSFKDTGEAVIANADSTQTQTSKRSNNICPLSSSSISKTSKYRIPANMSGSLLWTFWQALKITAADVMSVRSSSRLLLPRETQKCTLNRMMSGRLCSKSQMFRILILG